MIRAALIPTRFDDNGLEHAAPPPLCSESATATTTTTTTTSLPLILKSRSVYLLLKRVREKRSPIAAFTGRSRVIHPILYRKTSATINMSSPFEEKREKTERNSRRKVIHPVSSDVGPLIEQSVLEAAVFAS